MITTIKGVGVVHIPERNTKKVYNEMLIIEPENKQENIWCLHEECIEETEPFDSKVELFKHTCECHFSEDKCSYDPFLLAIKTEVIDL